MKVTETTITVPKRKAVSVHVGQQVMNVEHILSITDIDETPNATFIAVDGRWYGHKMFLDKFTIKD